MKTTTTETIEFEILHSSMDGKIRITATVAQNVLANVYGRPMLNAVADRIADKLVEAWVAQNGQALLDTLAPNLIADAVRQGLAARVLQILK